MAKVVHPDVVEPRPLGLVETSIGEGDKKISPEHKKAPLKKYLCVYVIYFNLYSVKAFCKLFFKKNF